ncbi:hypothetical protein V5O48_015470 [Marasmius crinis-equi]|uniref:Uncharacterized protein n=1 Tax=Marasmius crinis-equi TaxID=585013 RepID=A0ABR3EUG2_9AGAR
MQSPNTGDEPIAVDQNPSQPSSPVSSRPSTPAPLQFPRRGPGPWGGVDEETERRARRAAWTSTPNQNSWADHAVPRFVWRSDERILYFYVREDWVALPLSWLGIAERDTSLDNLETGPWSEVQLYRCSPQAADDNAGPPTFTGPQLGQRQASLRNELRDLRVQELTLVEDLAEVRSKIHDLEVAQANLKDLNVLAAGLRRD